MNDQAAVERLHLLADPRVGGPGLQVRAQWGMSVPARANAQFWDDPFGVGFRRPREITSSTFNGFLVAMDSSWELDGHRTFVNSRSELFFLDKVFTGDASEWDRFLRSDRDTSLSGGDGVFGTRPADQKKPLVRIRGEVGVAVGGEPSNWGSFVARVVPKAIQLRQLGMKKLLVFCRHPRQKELLNAIGWATEDIIEMEPWRRYSADSMVVVSERVDGLYLAPDAAADLAHVGQTFQNENTPKRVFVSRRGGIAARSGRYCLNGEEVERAVQDLGFHLMVPDTLSVPEQISHFAGADIIVGASGAGMFNTLFALGSPWVVDIESQSNWLHGHNGLFAGAGLRYGFQIAEADPDSQANHKPFYIHVDGLVARLRSILDDTGARTLS